MAAPVVPVMLAIPVPMASIVVLRIGEPCRLPLTSTPPATVNSARIKIRNGMNSATMVCTNSREARSAPNRIAMGPRMAADHAAEILPKW